MVSTAARPALASVVFLKIPEFGGRSVSEQARLRAQLEAALAVAMADIAPDERIVLDASDSVAVAVLGSARRALGLAQRVASAADAGLRVSIGVNHGAVRRVGNPNDPHGLTGDGIAAAAAIAQFAPPAEVLVTRELRNALAQEAPGVASGLRSAGVHSDSALRSYELYAPDATYARRRRRRLALASAIVLAACIGAGVLVRLGFDDRPRPLAHVTAKLERSARDAFAGLRAHIAARKF